MTKVLKIFQYRQNIFNKFIFILFAILLLNQKCLANPVQFFYPELPEKLEIFIDKKQIKKYYLILARISSSTKPIGKKEKRTFKAKVLFLAICNISLLCKFSSIIKSYPSVYKKTI